MRKRHAATNGGWSFSVKLLKFIKVAVACTPSTRSMPSQRAKKSICDNCGGSDPALGVGAPAVVGGAARSFAFTSVSSIIDPSPPRRTPRRRVFRYDSDPLSLPEPRFRREMDHNCDRPNGVRSDLPALRISRGIGDAIGRLRRYSHLCRLFRAAFAKALRLLRFLLLGRYALSAGPGRGKMLWGRGGRLGKLASYACLE